MSHIVRHKKEHNRGYGPGHNAIGNTNAQGRGKGATFSINGETKLTARGAAVKRREAERVDLVGRLVLAFEQAVTSGNVLLIQDALLALAEKFPDLAAKKRREIE